MKKFVPLSLLLCAFFSTHGESNVPTQYISGLGVKSLSSNGKWMVSELGYSLEKSLAITNLETLETWRYQWSGADLADQWDTAFTSCVSDDGVVVGEMNNVPSYWTPESQKWTNLPGFPVTDGYVAAIVGGITPDGSTIVGGLGKGAQDYDRQMTYPVIWVRQEDGSYSKPIYLPGATEDILGRSPQYFQCTSVSADGKVVGASMRDGMGAFCIPYVFRQESDGAWTCKMLGESLLNPNGLEILPFPGEFHGSTPDYLQYMTPQEQAEFYAKADDYLNKLVEEGKITTDDQWTEEEYKYAAEFMSAGNREKYEKELYAYLDWKKEYEEYLDFLYKFSLSAAEFQFNNAVLSPDGKYLYVSGSTPTSGGVVPIRFDTETLEATLFNSPSSYAKVTYVSNDYTVLAGESGEGMAYIFPANSTQGMTIVDYFADNEAIMEWMEENMIRDIVVSISNGVPRTEERWCVGMPYATPDLSLFGFSVDTSNWYPEPADGSFAATFLINTGSDSPGAVETIGNGTDGLEIAILSGGRIEVEGEISALSVHTLSGAMVFAVSNPNGVIATGLPSGLYIVTATLPSGATLSRKVLL